MVNRTYQQIKVQMMSMFQNVPCNIVRLSRYVAYYKTGACQKESITHYVIAKDLLNPFPFLPLPSLSLDSITVPGPW